METVITRLFTDTLCTAMTRIPWCSPGFQPGLIPVLCEHGGSRLTTKKDG